MEHMCYPGRMASPAPAMSQSLSFYMMHFPVTVLAVLDALQVYTSREQSCKQCACHRTLGHEAHMPCSTRLVAAWPSAPVKLVQKPFCAAPAPPPPDAGQLLGAQNLRASIQH